MKKIAIFAMVMFCGAALGTFKCCKKGECSKCIKYTPKSLTALLEGAFATNPTKKINAITVTNKNGTFKKTEISLLLDSIYNNITQNNINIIIFNEMFFAFSQPMQYKDMLEIRNKIAEKFKDTNCIVFVNFLYAEDNARTLSDTEKEQILKVGGRPNGTIFFVHKENVDKLCAMEIMSAFYRTSNVFDQQYRYFANESFIIACGEVISSYKKSSYCNEYNPGIYFIIEPQGANVGANVNNLIYFKGDGEDHIGLISKHSDTGCYDTVDVNFVGNQELKTLAETIHKYMYTEICYDVMIGIRFYQKFSEQQLHSQLHILMAHGVCNAVGGAVVVDDHAPNTDLSTQYFPKTINGSQNITVTVKSDSGLQNDEYDRAGVFVTKEVENAYTRKHYNAVFNTIIEGGVTIKRFLDILSKKTYE